VEVDMIWKREVIKFLGAILPFAIQKNFLKNLFIVWKKMKTKRATLGTKIFVKVNVLYNV